MSIDGAPSTLVGGAAAGNPNTISFNGTNDVQIFSTGANESKVQGNTIQGTGTNNDVGISVGIPAANGAVTGNTLTGNLISGHVDSESIFRRPELIRTPRAAPIISLSSRPSRPRAG